MRFLAILSTVVILLAAGPALGEDHPSPTSVPTLADLAGPGPIQDLTTLRLSPMFLEIREVLESTARRQEVLLKELAAATDEKQCELIVSRLEHLDLQRDLDILHIQADYARDQGRRDLEKQIRRRIADLTAQRDLAVR